jgi:hypothetical protein
MRYALLVGAELIIRGARLMWRVRAGRYLEAASR